MIFFMIFLILASIVSIILLSNINVFVHYSFNGKENSLQIKTKALFGLLSFRRELLKNQGAGEKRDFSRSDGKLHQVVGETGKTDHPISPDEATSPLRQIENMIEQIGPFYSLLKNFFQKIKVKQLIWTSEIGTGEAASTGIATGLGWAVKGNVVGMIRRLFIIKAKPEIQVYADFQKAVVRTNFHCMFQVRIGQTILASIQVFHLYRKMKKEQDKKVTVEKKNQTL